MKYKLFGLLALLLIISFLLSHLFSNKNIDLSKEQAKQLIYDATQTFRYVVMGGTPHPVISEDFSKQYIVDEKINSKEKVLHLLYQYYSKAIAETIYNNSGFGTDDHGFYMTSSDYVFANSWDEAIIQKIQGTKNKTVVVEVPNHTINENTEYKIKFIYEDNGWKINTLIF